MHVKVEVEIGGMPMMFPLPHLALVFQHLGMFLMDETGLMIQR